MYVVIIKSFCKYHTVTLQKQEEVEVEDCSNASERLLDFDEDGAVLAHAPRRTTPVVSI